MRTILTIFLLGMSGWAVGQSIDHVLASIENGKVKVTYDLKSSNPRQHYTVALYSSHNNYASSVRNVSGDVGNNVSPGISNTIVWDAKAELGVYEGTLTFRVRAEPIPLPFEFVAPTAGSAFRRGKSATFTWEGGLPNQEVQLEVLKGTEVALHLPSKKNSGSFVWDIPRDFAKGADYRFQLVSNGNSISSEPFMIKSKIPLLVKIAPVLVVGGVLYLILKPKDKTPNQEQTLSDLPPAPNAPN